MTTMFNEGFTVKGIQMDKEIKIRQVEREREREKVSR